MKPEPLTLEELHAIAVQRKDDAIIKTLLLEIKRLRGVVRGVHDRIGALVRYSPDRKVSQRFQVLTDLFEEEPCIDQPGRKAAGPSERDAKRTAREKRG